MSNPQLHRLVTAGTPVPHSRTEKAGEHQTPLGNFGILQLYHAGSWLVRPFFILHKPCFNSPGVSGICVSESGFGPSAEAPCV